MFTTVSFLITICTKYTERSGNVSDIIGKSYRTSQNEEQLCRPEVLSSNSKKVENFSSFAPACELVFSFASR